MNNFDGLIAALEDGFSRLLRLRNLTLEEIWGCEGVVATNAPILRVGSITDRLVLDVELRNFVREDELAGCWRGSS